MNQLRNSEVGSRVVSTKEAKDDLFFADMEASDYKQEPERLRLGTMRMKKNPTTDRSEAASNSAGSNLSSVGEMLNLQNYFNLQGKTQSI